MLQSESTHPPKNTFETATATSDQPHSTTHHHSHTHHGENRNQNQHDHHHDPFKIHIANFEPKEMTCPHCKHDVTTKLRYDVGGNSYSWCCCCFLLGCVLGCCLLPFCLNKFKDVTHICPRCNHDIATYKRNDPTNHRRI